MLAVLAGYLDPDSRALGSGFSSGTGQTGFGKAWRGVTDLQQAAVALMACVAVEVVILLDCVGTQTRTGGDDGFCQHQDVIIYWMLCMLP